jgi:hypothetical protein
VEDHYASLGFAPAGTDHDGSTWWSLDVAGAKVQSAPMLVHELGFKAEVEA